MAEVQVKHHVEAQVRHRVKVHRGQEVLVQV